MSLKAILLALGCVFAWCVLLPVLVIGGGTALFVYAVLAELVASLTGNLGKPLDTSEAREIARGMCNGYGVQGRGIRRQPVPYVRDAAVICASGPKSTPS